MKWKGVVYELSCKDCPCVYIGETGRTLEKRQSEHRTAVKKNDPKNRIAVHGWARGKSQLGRRFSQARGKRLLEEKDPFKSLSLIYSLHHPPFIIRCLHYITTLYNFPPALWLPLIHTFSNSFAPQTWTVECTSTPQGSPCCSSLLLPATLEWPPFHLTPHPTPPYSHS